MGLLDSDAEMDDLLALIADDSAVDEASEMWLFPNIYDSPGLLAGPLLTDDEWSETPSPGASRTTKLDTANGGQKAIQAIDAKKASRVVSTPVKRRTRKQEIEGLRRQVDGLTLELNRMKTEAGIDLATPVVRVPLSAVSVTVAASLAPGGLRLWRRLAEKQRRLRQGAEKDNKKLREAVTVHARRAKRLHLMLQNRARDDERSISPLLPKPSLSAVPQDNDEVYRGFAQGMDAMYAEVDSVFRSVNMAEVPRPGHLSSADCTGTDTWQVNMRHAHIFPFEFKQTERVIWASNCRKDAPSQMNESKVDYSFVYAHALLGKLSIRMRMLARRYCEADRTVLISRTLIETGFFSVVVTVTNRTVIRRGPPSMINPTTIVETYMQAVGTADPEGWEVIRSQADPKDAFSLSLWDHSVWNTFDAVEDKLVEESIGKPHRSM